MYLALLRPGKMLYYVQSHSFYLDLLAWAFCIGIVTFVIVSTLRSKRRTVEKPTATPMGSIPPHLLTKAGRIGKTAGLVVLGMFLGWSWRSYQYDRARIAYQQEHAAWQQRNTNWNQEHAAYQEAVARWKAKQKENR